MSGEFDFKPPNRSGFDAQKYQSAIPADLESKIPGPDATASERLAFSQLLLDGMRDDIRAMVAQTLQHNCPVPTKDLWMRFSAAVGAKLKEDMAQPMILPDTIIGHMAAMYFAAKEIHEALAMEVGE